MAAINFPDNPNLNDEFTSGGTSWRWNGTAWIVIPPANITFNNVDTTDIDTSTLVVTTSANITGLTVNGGISGLSLSSLSDIGDTPPVDQQYLRYNASNNAWFPYTLNLGSDGGGSFDGGTVSNPIYISSDTISTSTSTGALRVQGGAGIIGNLNVGGTLTVEDEFLDLKADASIRLYNTSNNNYVGFKAPNAPDGTIWVLPATDGVSGQFLRTNGSGTLSWASAAGAGGGTPPGGADTQVQFNDNGSFGGDAGLTFNSITQVLTVPDITSDGTFETTDTTESTSASTGSIITAGGVGVGGNINVSGAENSFTGDTASTSINTGTIVVTGGVGVSGTMNVGSTVSANADPTDAEHLTNKRYVDANVLAFSVAFGA